MAELSHFAKPHHGSFTASWKKYRTMSALPHHGSVVVDKSLEESAWDSRTRTETVFRTRIGDVQTVFSTRDSHIG